MKDPDRFFEPLMPSWEADVRHALEELATTSDLSHVERFRNFPVFTARQTITRFLARYELFKMIQEIPGAIVECGVLFGAGIFSFGHFSAIMEPYNAQRRVVGFDTFTGLTEVHDKDRSEQESGKMRTGAMNSEAHDMLLQAIHAYDLNRPLNHLPRIELVKGDLRETMPRYFESHPHTLVALLYLDMDIYLPTRAALENCLTRMPKGALVVFDEFSCERWPGETVALLETLGVQGRKLRRFPFDSYLTYLIIE